MGIGSKVGSFFANRSIGTRISVGFIFVLAIFAASVGHRLDGISHHERLDRSICRSQVEIGDAPRY
jgi:hypothetical protein